MPVTDDRQKNGSLTLGTGGAAKTFHTQSTSVALVPSVRSVGDEVEVLSGDVVSPDETYDWSLNLGLIQDFSDSAGVIEYLRANAGDEVAFAWFPNGTAISSTTPKYSGTVKVRPTTIGGGVNVRLTSEVELPVTDLDDPDYTP